MSVILRGTEHGAQAQVSVGMDPSPNLCVAVRHLPKGAQVRVWRDIDGEWYDFRELTYTDDGIRVLALPAGAYKVDVTADFELQGSAYIVEVAPVIESTQVNPV